MLILAENPASFRVKARILTVASKVAHDLASAPGSLPVPICPSPTSLKHIM